MSKSKTRTVVLTEGQLATLRNMTANLARAAEDMIERSQSPADIEKYVAKAIHANAILAALDGEVN